MKSVLLFVLQEDRFGVVWGVKKGKLIGAATEDWKEIKKKNVLEPIVNKRCMTERCVMAIGELK